MSLTAPRIRPGRLKALRLAAQLTKQHVATHVGCSLTALWQWETGQRQPSPAMVVKLTHVLAQVPGREGD